MPRPVPLTYLRTELNVPGETFISQWGKLSEKDKQDLKDYADAEMDVLAAAGASQYAR